jgi:hypothetical protein
LLARAVEQSAESGFRVARLTVAFHKPLAIGSYRVRLETLRDGRKVKVARAYLLPASDEKKGPSKEGSAGAGEEGTARAVAAAEALLIRSAPVNAEGPSMKVEPHTMLLPDACEPFVLPFFLAPVGYHVAMETRLMHGRFGDGHMGLWMKMRIPLLVGEKPSALQRVACAADSGNGVSVGVDVKRFTFLNPDVTFTLSREPQGEWVGLDARTSFAADGIGLADTQLLDERGTIGRAVQPLLLEPR